MRIRSGDNCSDYAIQVFEMRQAAVIVGVRLPVNSLAELWVKAVAVAELFGGAAALRVVRDPSGQIVATEKIETIGTAPFCWEP